MSEYLFIVKVYTNEDTYEYEHGNIYHALEHYDEEIRNGNKATLFKYKDGKLERYHERTNTWG